MLWGSSTHGKNYAAVEHSSRSISGLHFFHQNFRVLCTMQMLMPLQCVTDHFAITVFRSIFSSPKCTVLRRLGSARTCRGRFKSSPLYSVRDGVPPFPNWRRPRGCPPITWLHQICSDCGLSAGDALNCAQDRAVWRTYATASSASR